MRAQSALPGLNKVKRVYMRVHQRKGGQSYHRPTVNSSEFLFIIVPIFSISEKKSLDSREYLNLPELN